jgi:putative nucleotidyltransferase with HDIG domain/PAS domain S-box-containing protein
MSDFMFAKQRTDHTDATDSQSKKNRWKILIVDDEKDIHSVTELVLGDFEFDGQKLHFINAYSAKEAKSILQEHSDIALVLLDVVMESDNAGLEVVEYIRNDLKNHLIRIVLRTGQPGMAPEEQVIASYDINDYKDKTELTSIKLKSTVHNAIKSYRDMVSLAENADTLLKYKNMFNSATDFIFMVDRNNSILEAIKAFLEAIGKTHDEIVGDSLFNLFSFDGVHTELQYNIAKSMDGSPVHYNSELLFDNLGKRFVDIEFFPYYDEKHDLGAVVINLHDITQDVIQREETDRLRNKQIASYQQTVYSFVDMIERRDSYTAGHTNRVADYAKRIAQEMKIDEADIETLYKAAMLHDIGKITTPDSILLKPGKFNEFEYNLIKEHLNTGYELLKNIDMYAELAEVMVLHHERYDGKGYPNGLKGDEISILGHIMIVADAFDAMTTDRIYKKRKDIKAALDEMVALKKQQFHPDVVDAALIAFKDMTINVDKTSQLPQTKAEKARFAYFFKDPLTGAYNQDYLNTVLSIENEPYQYAHYINVHNMTAYNSEYGWDEGDVLLRNISHLLREHYPNHLKFRVHGDDFFLLAKDEIPIDVEQLNIDSRIIESGIEISVQSLQLKERNIHTAEDLEHYFQF